VPESVSRFYEVPFSTRAPAALLMLVSIALWDFLRKGKSSTRWQEYGFWLACGAIGALFGMANDAVTSRLSAAYFTIGKGLTDDPEQFRAAVVELGASTGSFAGVVVGGVFLLANNPGGELPQLRYGALATFLVIPIVGAIVMALVLGVLSRWDVQGLAPALRQVLSEGEVQRFLAVHRAHAGLYMGGLASTGASIVKIRQRRRRLVRFVV
jgi:hypothetical protein